jgi:hypothetical protein
LIEDHEKRQDMKTLESRIDGMEKRVLQAVSEKKITKQDAARILQKNIVGSLQPKEHLGLEVIPGGKSPPETNKQ